MNEDIIWILLMFVYAIFIFWYRGFGKRILPEEVDGIINKLRDQNRDNDNFDEGIIAVIRYFLQGDDGKSFVMINLIELNEPKKESEKLLNGYSAPFLRRLLLKGGHPVFFSQASAKSVEYWGLAQGGETWDVAAGVRYRSRRDMIEMVLWPKFQEVHPIKKEAIKKTIAFPASMAINTGSVSIVFAMMLIIIGLAIG